MRLILLQITMERFIQIMIKPEKKRPRKKKEQERLVNVNDIKCASGHLCNESIQVYKRKHKHTENWESNEDKEKILKGFCELITSGQAVVEDMVTTNT